MSLYFGNNKWRNWSRLRRNRSLVFSGTKKYRTLYSLADNICSLNVMRSSPSILLKHSTLFTDTFIQQRHKCWMKFSFTKSYPTVCSKLVSSISVRFQRNAISFTTGSDAIEANSSFKTTWLKYVFVNQNWIHSNIWEASSFWNTFCSNNWWISIFYGSVTKLIVAKEILKMCLF